jgi:uncharacterized protein YkwD
VRVALTLSLVLACLIAAGSASAGTYSNLLAPAGTCGTAADQLNLDPATAETAMTCLTNWARAQQGLAPLKVNATLDAAGDAKLGADLSCGAFTHTPCGNPFSNVFASYLTGATSYTIGENIAWGTGAFGTPRGTMDAWLNSDDHRANILDSRYTELGIGYQPDETFLGYSGATLWSQEFGTRNAPAVAAKPAAKPAVKLPAAKPKKHRVKTARR